VTGRASSLQITAPTIQNVPFGRNQPNEQILQERMFIDWQKPTEDIKLQTCIIAGELGGTRELAYREFDVPLLRSQCLIGSGQWVILHGRGHRFEFPSVF